MNRHYPSDSPSRPSIVVVGRRWFDRKNGNTYHTSEILVNGVREYKSERAYGYGDHYLDGTAAEWLESKGYVVRERYEASGGCEALWRACERLRITLAYSVSDVGRRKDL